MLPSVRNFFWDSQRMVWTRSGYRRTRRAAPAAEGRPCGWRPARSPLPCPKASMDTASGWVERSLRGVNHSHPNRSPLRCAPLRSIGETKALLPRSHEDLGALASTASSHSKYCPGGYVSLTALMASFSMTSRMPSGVTRFKLII